MKKTKKLISIVIFPIFSIAAIFALMMFFSACSKMENIITPTSSASTTNTLPNLSSSESGAMTIQAEP